MTTKISNDKCFTAKSTLSPDCFKLRIGYDPTTLNYDVALCNLIVIFSNCCLDAANIILRIPLNFSQDCFLYRINVSTSTGTLNNVTVFVGAIATPLNYYVIDDYLNIVIPAEAFTLSQTGQNQCIYTITFSSFSIPVRKVSNFNNSCPLCSSIQWMYGTQIGTGGGGGSTQTITNLTPGTLAYPSGIRSVVYTISGGGGGGGGGSNDVSNFSSAGGGGGGASAMVVQGTYNNPYPYLPFSIYYTIGAGGSGGSANAGSAGGNGGLGGNTTIRLGSSIGAIIATSIGGAYGTGGTGGTGINGGIGGTGGTGGAGGGGGSGQSVQGLGGISNDIGIANGSPGTSGAGGNGAGGSYMGTGGGNGVYARGGGGGGGSSLTGIGGNGGDGSTSATPTNGGTGAGGGGGFGIGSDAGPGQSGGSGGNGYFLSVSS